MNYSQATTEFYRHCLARNLSRETIGMYERVLNRLEKTMVKEGLGERGKDINIEEVTPTMIRLHFSILLEQMQPVTLRIHYRLLHSFFTFLKSEEITSRNIMDRVEKPKVPKKEMEAFSKEEIDTLLSVFDKNTFVGYRNYVLTCLLFGTGLRRSEAVKVRIDDIRFDINIIKVMGKGSKFRNVPIGDSLRRVLIKYINIRHDEIKKRKLNDSPYLFINSRNGNKLGIETLTGLYNTVGREEGIRGVRVSPHTFRHTFAKFFLLNGGDVFTLQKILGHSDITTTKKYINLNTNDIRVQNDKYNPFENECWRYL